MGASASRGWDNQSLIDKLLEGGPQLPPNLERAMRLVDRGDYFEEKSSRAYMDLAWRSGSLHLSAPSIYISALKNLDLAPGQHFLNIGSGSGYLSTIVGLILGHKGVNHGIEVNENNVAFSRQRLGTFLASADAPCERDFCIPRFVHGNVFDLVIPPSLRNGSANRAVAVHGSEEDSDSDTHAEEDEDLHDLSRNEEPNVDNDAEMSGEGMAAERPQVATTESSGDSTSPSRRLRIAVFPIDPPPVVHSNGKNQSMNDVKQWPMYDRIYVGGGVRNRIQLQGLLRLLKVGGVMVAPVQDELLKITRLSENRISRVDLLSVSFASLVVPPANGDSKLIEPPPSEEVPSLNRLCARFIRQLLRAQIESRQQGLPVLGRLIEVERRGAKTRKKKKNETYKEHLSPEHEHEYSSPISHSTDASEDSESDHTEMDGDCQIMDDSAVSENPAGHSSQDGDQISPHSDRSESPDTRGDRGSMVRFLHHLLLRSRLGRSGGTVPSNPNSTSTANDETETRRNPEPTGSDDRSRILVLNLSREPEPIHDEDASESSGSRMRFHLRVAERLMAVIDGTENEPELHDSEEGTHANGQSSGEQMSDGANSSTENPETQAAGESQSNSRQRQEKRRRGFRYQPPSYKYREEMRRILSEELHLPEFFVRQVFIM